MWQGAHVVAIGVAAQEGVGTAVAPSSQACKVQDARECFLHISHH